MNEKLFNSVENLVIRLARLFAISLIVIVFYSMLQDVRQEVHEISDSLCSFQEDKQ